MKDKMKMALVQDIELFVENGLARRNILHLLELLLGDAYARGQVDGIMMGIKKLHEVKKSDKID